MTIKSYIVTCNSCPHQTEGELEDGRHFYFRARWDEWTLGIGNTPTEAIDISASDTPLASGIDPQGKITYGDAPDAARAIVTAIIGGVL